ncbi:MAG: MFS transporter [Dehalococcoidales bacterium]|nr:MFS transporter [Dehalococcoidales bacterium]
MSENPHPPGKPADGPAYRWVALAASSLMICITYGLIYSYGVFFKPISAHFGWDRASVSMVYSLSVIIRGAAGIGTGWLADRHGARKIVAICGILMGAGYLLSSTIDNLWQFFLSYAVLEAIGMSAIFGVGMAEASRWFTVKRGLALGIAASGSGLGTFIIVPLAERLVNALGWSKTFFAIGIATGVIITGCALFLRRPPSTGPVAGNTKVEGGTTFGEALRDMRLYLIMVSFLLFFFGTQIVIVHLVNHATDIGIDPLIAATFVSIIGLSSIGSRLVMGAITERIGIHRALLTMCLFLLGSFVLLLFIRSSWAFYLFAVLFGIPYGGEVTQIPLAISRYFGTRAMGTLMGLTLFITGLGGACGAWLAGKIFDLTDSYTWAFITGAIAAIGSAATVWLLQRQDKKGQQPGGYLP